MTGSSKNKTRAWLGIYFKCANVYRRIFKTEDGRSYRGLCPRCGQCLKIPVGKGGTSDRVFEASCR